MPKKGRTLEAAWNKRLQLYAESEQHLDPNFTTDIRAEGLKLQAEGDLLWANAILSKFGNIKMVRWNIQGDCYLENGEVYKTPRKRG